MISLENKNKGMGDVESEGLPPSVSPSEIVKQTIALDNNIPQNVKEESASLNIVFYNSGPTITSTDDLSGNIDNFNNNNNKKEKNENAEIKNNTSIQEKKSSSTILKRTEAELKINTEMVNNNNNNNKNNNDIPSTIFSIKGTPSRKPRKTIERTSNVLGQSNNNLNNVNSRSNLTPIRNPLTGIGVTSKDEFKTNKPLRKRDGNPVLGVGYEDKRDPLKTTISTHRIPPGGYSNGLW